MSIFHETNAAARTCAIHNPGDLACNRDCPGYLGEVDDPAPDDEESEVVDLEPVRESRPSPQTCAFHVGGMHCPDGCEGRMSPSIGPADVDEMDEATADIIARDAG